MNKINITSQCSKVIRGAPEMKDWGFSFMLDNELDALRVAYLYREAPHGVKAEHCPNVGKFMVTVFNETAKAAGIDGAK